MATAMWCPIASLGLQSEENRGFMWVLTHRHPGVVPPSTPFFGHRCAGSQAFWRAIIRS